MRNVDFLTVVADEVEPCPYLPDQHARMPLQFPVRAIHPAQLDQLLALGYRRSGSFFYHTQCPACSACTPIRVDVNQFRPSRSQRRARARGDAVLSAQLAPASVDPTRVALMNKHRLERGLAQGGGQPVDESGYAAFLLNSPCQTLELSLWLDGQLIAISVMDVGQYALSAVYCFFDPAESRLSPGTYAILKQLELVLQLGRRWLYLGYYVAENTHLNYKAKYRPHQRLLKNGWQDFD